MNISLAVITKITEILTPFFQYLTEDYSGISLSERKKMTKHVMTLAAPASTAITVIPMPGGIDAIGITFVQMVMVRAIGNIYDQENCRITGTTPQEWIASAFTSLVNIKSLKEMVAVVGAGWLGQQVCLLIFRVVTWYIPGWMVGVFVGAWTTAIGTGAERHFQKIMSDSESLSKDT